MPGISFQPICCMRSRTRDDDEGGCVDRVVDVTYSPQRQYLQYRHECVDMQYFNPPFNGGSPFRGGLLCRTAFVVPMRGESSYGETEAAGDIV